MFHEGHPVSQPTESQSGLGPGDITVESKAPGDIAACALEECPTEAGGTHMLALVLGTLGKSFSLALVSPTFLWAHDHMALRPRPVTTGTKVAWVQSPQP